MKWNDGYDFIRFTCGDDIFHAKTWLVEDCWACHTQKRERKKGVKGVEKHHENWIGGSQEFILLFLSVFVFPFFFF